MNVDFVSDLSQYSKLEYALLKTCLRRARFEPDMLAFSGCYYGGGDKETKELGKIRKRWKTLHVSHYLF